MTRGRWRPQPQRADPRKRTAQRAALERSRQRVRNGERCYFWRNPDHPRCPGVINLNLPANDPWALTTHHIQRIMDGGPAVVDDPRYEAPAHRSCNSADGLRAQNQRRKSHSVTVTNRHGRGERTSEPW